MRRWPDVLPTPSFPGFGLSPIDPSLRTEWDVGPARVRRVTFATGDNVDVMWIFTDTEMAAFRAWYGDRAVSLAGDSDDLTAWTATGVTRNLALTVGPDDCIPTRIVETTATSTHGLSKPLPTLITENQTVILCASIGPSGRNFARLRFEARDGTSFSAVINLNSGAIIGTPDAPVTVLARGAGFWRLQMTVNTGSGALDPVLHIEVMQDATTASYEGDNTAAIRVCEVMARAATGFDLFVRSGPDGNALGAAGGAGWSLLPMAVGGGFAFVESRFIGTFKATGGNGLEWTVTAKMETRDA
ncbi:MAG: phage head spike fiber domain-containing protein [Cypionkella sp.]